MKQARRELLLHGMFSFSNEGVYHVTSTAFGGGTPASDTFQFGGGLVESIDITYGGQGRVRCCLQSATSPGRRDMIGAGRFGRGGGCDAVGECFDCQSLLQRMTGRGNRCKLQCKAISAGGDCRHCSIHLDIGQISTEEVMANRNQRTDRD